MNNFINNYISHRCTVRDALVKLNTLKSKLTLFVRDDDEKLIGTLTDGDIRRGLLKNHDLSDPITSMMCKDFHFLVNAHPSLEYFKNIKELGVELLPVLNDDKTILKVLDLLEVQSILPVDAVIMAGGRGERLQPLTDNVPKPLLIVGGKPIIEHNIDNLIKYGVEYFYITIKYLGNQIVDYFGAGEKKEINIKYIMEDAPLGTIGAVRKIVDFKHPNILIMNSDLFTNINFEDLFITFQNSNADMAVATIPYNVNVPYAVLNEKEGKINTLKEKPTFTYYSNAGIYILKREILDFIPLDKQYNATDLIQDLIDKNYKVVTCPIVGYWVDIGRHEDYEKVKEFTKHLRI